MKDKRQREESGIEVLLEFANSIIATLREPFLVLDSKLTVISANHAFYTTFKVTKKKTLGQSLPALGKGQWNIPKLLQLLERIISKKKAVRDFEVESYFNHIGHRVMLLNACQLRVPMRVAAIIASGGSGGGGEEGREGDKELILLAIEDITERAHLQDELKESEERYRRAFETSRTGLLLIHKMEADILNSNAAIQELLGYSQKEFMKMKLWDIGVTKDKKDFQEMLSRLEKDGVIHYEDVPAKAKNGTNINTEVFLVNRAKVMQCNIRDNTESKRIRDELEEKIHDLERFSKFAVDRELKMEELEKKEKELEKKLKNG
jgi:PAS domain S-box-containing protein